MFALVVVEQEVDVGRVVERALRRRNRVQAAQGRRRVGVADGLVRDRPSGARRCYGAIAFR